MVLGQKLMKQIRRQIQPAKGKEDNDVIDSKADTQLANAKFEIHVICFALKI